MTTTRPAAPAPPSGAAQRVSLARVVRSEWTKLRSLPSTGWSLLAAIFLIVGFGALYSLLRVTRPPSQPEAASSASRNPPLRSVRAARARLPRLWPARSPRSNR